MKVTLIANISVNGKILLSDNPNHQNSQEAMAFYLKRAKEIGNLVIGKKTYEIFQQIPNDSKDAFLGIEIVLISTELLTTDKYKVVNSPEEAIKYLSEKGFREIAIGGGTKTYNSFFEKDLVTDIYFNISLIITGDGGVLANNIDLNTEFKLIDHKINDEFVQLHLAK